jgi:hypothetical protein
MSEGATIEHWGIIGFNKRKMEDHEKAGIQFSTDQGGGK